MAFLDVGAVGALIGVRGEVGVLLFPGVSIWFPVRHEFGGITSDLKNRLTRDVPHVP